MLVASHNKRMLMIKIVIFGLFLLSNVAHTSTSNIIQLTSERSFNKNLCSSIYQLKVQKINKEEINRFRVDHDDYVTIRLNGKNNAGCYSFKYYPETSSMINISIKNYTLSILEMIGSTANENWLEKIYRINIKGMSLTQKQAKLISFFMNEKGNVQKDISDW
ncbi:hypothetical protein [Acinetobacter guerrae]|uniref:hypothetical protein n=1 Tax=Acinetobacter guerrae TaxID=1843371 RepID=UPI00128B1D63|nr:hypothetical protein [Acinetobacter guerrae]MPW43325.1 hypothetical protein [Acinetobacter guerrae]